jgi:hypothetical protein
VLTCIDDDPQVARDIIKPQLAWYLNILEKIMFKGTNITDQDLAPIKEAYTAGKIDDANQAVSDKIIDQMTVVGDAEACIQGLKRFEGTGLTHPIIFGPIGVNDAQAIARLGQDVIPHVLSQ